MKKYQINYCGKELDSVFAKSEKDAIKKVRNKINFEAIVISTELKKEDTVK